MEEVEQLIDIPPLRLDLKAGRLLNGESLIELRRRLLARADVALVNLARLAAQQENTGASADIDDLVNTGFLAANFGSRPDGSGVIGVGDRLVDTLRGARGTFLPIADVTIDQVSEQESSWYQQIADHYSQNFPTFPLGLSNL